MYISASVKDIFDEPKSMRRAWASNTATRPELLTQLADDPFPEIRELVARNKNTPLKVLDKLLDDPYPEVREDAATTIFQLSRTKVHAETLNADNASGVVEFYFIINDGSPDIDIPKIPELVTDYINSEGYNVDSIDTEIDSEYESDYMVYIWVSSIFDTTVLDELTENLGYVLDDALDGWIEDGYYTRLLKPRNTRG